MKLHKFKNTYFEVGIPKFHAGLAYKPTEETQRAVLQGHAEEVDLPEKHLAHPFNDPRVIEARKANLRRLIAAHQAELEQLEELPPGTPAPEAGKEGEAHGAKHDEPEKPAAGGKK